MSSITAPSSALFSSTSSGLNDDYAIVEDDSPPSALTSTRTLPTILCCVCGTPILSNAANMCVPCLRNQVDITAGMPKQCILHQCRGCLRYLRPPWVACELESKELLAICLKKINGLSRVKLIDAGFIWTEPHSRRILVKLTVQKDVLNGVKVQQVFAVEFVLQNQQCDACQRSYTDHTWRAQVQVRQKVDHKKTFFLLEQLILRHGMHEKCINVEQVPTGVDFFFGERSHALKFIEFVTSVVPSRSKAAKQLISEDIHEAIKNYKFAYAIEVVPLCKDDLVVLPSKLAAQAGNMNPVCLVLRISSHVYLLDPRTLQIAEVAAEKYWREPCRSLMATSQLTEFTVLDVTPVTVQPISGKALRKQMNGRVPRSSPSSRVGSIALSEGGGGGGMSVASGSRPLISHHRASSVSLGSLAGTKRSIGGRYRSKHDVDEDEDGRPRNDNDDDDNVSVAGASSIVGGSTTKGGFTGGVSLAGGSVHFNGAMSVATTVTGGPKGKMLLADVEVVRTRDLGVSDTRFSVRTHLGNILRPGDACMGYDLSNAVFNDADAESSSTMLPGKGGKGRGGIGSRSGRSVDLPDIVLVRKVSNKQRIRDADDLIVGKEAVGGGASSSASNGNATTTTEQTTSREGGGGGGRRKNASASSDGAMAIDGVSAPPKSKPRLWKLKRLDEVVKVTHSDVVRRSDEEKEARDYESFLQEIESDSDLRKGINLYKNHEAIEKAAARAALQRQQEGRQADHHQQRNTSSSGGANGSGNVKGSEIASNKSTSQANVRVTFGGKSRHAISSKSKSMEEEDEEDEEDDNDGEEDNDKDDDDDGGEIGLEELLDELDIDNSSHPQSQLNRVAEEVEEEDDAEDEREEAEEEEEEEVRSKKSTSSTKWGGEEV